MSAASYGLATPVGTDLVSEGDDVISLNAERVADLFDELRFARGNMPSGTNLDLMSEAGAWHIPNVTIAGSLTGTPLPVIFPGNFINIPGTTIVKTQLFTPYGDNAALWWRVGDGINTWEPWAKAGKDNPDSQFYRGFMPNGTDVDLFASNGAFGIPNSTAADSMIGTWPVKFPGVFINIQSTTLAKAQIYMPYSGQAAMWWRVGLGFTTFTPWVNAGESSDSGGAAGLANRMHIDYLETYFGGTVPTGGVGAVAFRNDHGLNNFNSLMRPLHESRGIPYSLAISSRRWDQAENNTVTPTMVNGWVLGDMCEIWNHGALAHSNATGYAANHDYWVNGLSELRAQIPDAFISGVVIPGTGVSGQFDGMGGVGTPQSLYDTDAGRLILGNHAVVTGAFPNTDMRPLDGKLRQGQGHYGMESRTAAVIIARIKEAQAQRKGLQLMMHPSLIGTPGYISVADYTAVLDYVAAERDAGRLAVLSPYELLIADSTIQPKVENAVGRTVKVWDSENAREQLIYGDTGWRNITPLGGDVVTSGNIRIMRTAQLVTLHMDLVKVSTTGFTDLTILPFGFRNLRWFRHQMALGETVRVMGSGLRLENASPTDTYDGIISWPAYDPWPTTAPGIGEGGPY